MNTSSPGLLLQRLRWALFRNSLRVVMGQSLPRVLTIFLCSGLIWGLLFYVSWMGFHELKTRWDIPLDISLMAKVFDLMFLALTVMLIFSTGIILYASLFTSPESQFLLSTPLPDDHIFAYKYQGAVAFSSWAFILLGSPILIAYGLEVGDGAPWYFYIVLPAFFLGFVLLPGSLGALCALLLVNLVPKRRKQILVLAIVLLFAGLALWGVRALVEASQSQFGTRTWFDSLVEEIRAVPDRLAPVQWIGLGLRAAALGEAADMGYYL
ncbi:MAG: hypothetical protein L0215_14840, partial [Gemmataceae bacterium]|nr:hypothetical protein [Gemmataceae bacterium]